MSGSKHGDKEHHQTYISSKEKRATLKVIAINNGEKYAITSKLKERRRK